MLPSRLNLLSPEKIKRLNFLSNFQFIKNILEFFIIIISISGIVLLGGQIVLEDFSNELNSTLNTLQSQNSDKNKQIKQINNTLTSVDKIQKEFKQFSPLIPQIVAAIPDDVLLKTLSMDLANKKVLLEGYSPTRETLLKLQENLSSNRDKFNKLEKQKSLINSWEELKSQNTNNNEVEYLIKEKGEKLFTAKVRHRQY